MLKQVSWYYSKNKVFKNAPKHVPNRLINVEPFSSQLFVNFYNRPIFYLLYSYNWRYCLIDREIWPERGLQSCPRWYWWWGCWVIEYNASHYFDHCADNRRYVVYRSILYFLIKPNKDTILLKVSFLNCIENTGLGFVSIIKSDPQYDQISWGFFLNVSI